MSPRSAADRSAAGRRSKVSGKVHEGWVETQHAKAVILGIVAHVEHNEGHTEMVGRQLKWVSPGISDYTAVLEGGRYAAIEAKALSGERFSRSSVSPLQQAHLHATAKAGGLALLVIDFKTPTGLHRRFAVEWLSVPWEVARSAESVTPKLLAGWEVREDCYLLRWHPGGKRSSFGSRNSTYPSE